MDDFLSSPSNEQTAERRPRISWGKKAIPLKNSTLFSKTKHSEEWHQGIDATAGVLHPSDPKFPSGYLRDHTDKYLRKKKHINQADIDIRLAILVCSHDARDIAIAAVAHAITAQSLRALLAADLNVMQGSLWGLQGWLQCLIAANDSNPASVTDLEALWARKLLPFATHGSRAAERCLMGMCRILREVNVPSMGVLPEFSVLMKRAIADYTTQLDGLKLRGEWAAAYDAVLWMMELAKTSPAVSTPGSLRPEHILDSQFPSWRMWACWRPNILGIQGPALLSDFLCLDGPDVVIGTESTLREGLVAQYCRNKPLLRWRGLLIEVPGSTKQSLRSMLDRITKAAETVAAASSAFQASISELFRCLLVTQPISGSALDLFEATLKITPDASTDIYNTVREIYSNRNQLEGCHIVALQNLMKACDDSNSEDLRSILLRDWLRHGIENCLQDCQKAVISQIGSSQQWIHLLLEYHTFCSTLTASEHHWPTECQTIRIPPSWPSREHIEMVADIYMSARAQRSNHAPNTSQITRPRREIARSDGLVDQASKPSKSTGEDEDARHPLEEHVEAYCKDLLLVGKAMARSSQETIASILHVWESTKQPSIDVARRELAILVSRNWGMDFVLRCNCLSEIATGKSMQPPGVLAKSLLETFRRFESDSPRATVALTNILINRKAPTQCWRELLYLWLEHQECSGTGFLDSSLQIMTAAEWLTFMRHIEMLCVGLSQNPASTVLQPSLLTWKTQLQPFTSTLTRLEQVLGQGSGPLQCLLTCSTWEKSLLSILQCLKNVKGTRTETLMQKTVGMLSNENCNHLEINECILHLSKASPEVVQTCFRIWDAKHGQLYIPGWTKTVRGRTTSCTRTATSDVSAMGTLSIDYPELTIHETEHHLATAPLDTLRKIPLAAVEVMVAGWIQSDAINGRDRNAIASVASVLRICVETYHPSVWKSKLTEAMTFWEKIEDEIVMEAARLETLQNALKAKDAKGTALLLQELGVPDSSLLDEEIAGLPAGIIDVVEKVSETEVQISFSLSAFTQLQKRAMGIPTGAVSLLLGLSFHSLEDIPSFCVHLDNEKGLDDLQHSPWVCSENSRPPQEILCGTSQTLVVWQLNRIIHTQLRIGNSGIAGLHRLVKKRLEEMGRFCISCGASHNANNAHLRRATPCSVLSCARLWYQLPLEVRVPEIKSDIFAVDALLTAVYAAAMSGRSELLPSCPIYGTEAIKATLNSLPNLTIISHATNIAAFLRSYHKDAEKLISWAVVHHRGYFATATGSCKVPTMPAGTHQFILANASPRLEDDFVSQLPRPDSKTTVLFHGTTLDRLPAILAGGLKVCSGTSLQRTGAAHGKGIYLASEPSTSLSYSPAQISFRNSGLTNMRLLLGCEVVGTGRSVSSGIHVIKNEKSVMVRYIFFLTSSASSPVANHIVPAMASGMSALRRGVV